jgi:hypothetical protein
MHGHFVDNIKLNSDSENRLITNTKRIEFRISLKEFRIRPGF